MANKPLSLSDIWGSGSSITTAAPSSYNIGASSPSIGTYSNSSISSSQFWGNLSDSVVEHKIQGKMFTANFDMNDMEFNSKMQDPDEIKRRLLNLLVDEIYKQNHIEFTKQYDVNTGTYRFHARLYAVPDTMVRIIREKVK